MSGIGAVDDGTHAKRVFEEVYGGEVESIVVTYMGHDWFPLVMTYGLTILGGTPLFIPIYEETMIKIENG